MVRIIKKIDDHNIGPGGGAIQGTASEALLVVLLAARDKVLREVGKDALGRLVVYGSDQTHSALRKACQIAGNHPENCRLLRTDTCNEYKIHAAKKSVNEKCRKLSKRVAFYTVDCRDSCGEIFVDLQKYSYAQVNISANYFSYDVHTLR
ncbi:Aromatic-L-amino-acid decarboxylase [Artemisia annua]|uniref:Aromatic-L-amino-acid decarboxylase n=1 Tax=Artemisia annua TaxID=35608 RepID=A0A2U1KKH2_ARTAN|nr:Aromatic-L-amino-acid decarboxylase [Artemisia annua]